MIIRILKDAKEGHYLWMRKKNEANVAKIANFGVIFLTLFIYYVSIYITISELIYKYTNQRDNDTSILTNVPLIFGPYLVIYFLLIYPKIKIEIDENISENEKSRKKKTATIYFITCILMIPISGIIVNLINGH